MTGFDSKRQMAQGKLDDDDDTLTIVYQRGFADGKRAAQRPWVGLTDDEIQECLQGLPTQTVDVYARRIEAKLKERNT